MKILMVISRMGIGGAETHVLELSRELSEMGHAVTVASAGGALVGALEAAGIRHVSLPLDSRRPTDLLRAVRGLSRTVRTLGIDILHAHGRLPCVLCRAVQVRTGARFVSTAHLDFKAGFFSRRLIPWGERVLAVSCDLKKYLIDTYCLPPDTIRLAHNGIDTARFSPCPQPPEGAPVIVSVSRLDGDRSAPARMLIDAAEDLLGGGGTLVIVGGGEDFDELSAKAERANRALGRCAVEMAGAVTDVLPYLRRATVAVGVSRAALEAMACEVPTVLAGNQGYLGLFDCERAPRGIETNFCCRGDAPLERETLVRDVLRVLALPEGARQALGKCGRAFVLAHYSARCMAEETAAMYASLPARERGADIVISGYYGFSNLGDDAILFSMIGALKDALPSVRIAVLSHRPRKMAGVYGVRCIGRRNYGAIYRAMRRAKLFISGGGTLLQDGTSTLSLRYYLRLIGMAQHAGTRTMLYASGIGPLRRKQSRALTAKLLLRADAISLRDGRSAEMLADLGIPRERILLAADPAFARPPERGAWEPYAAASRGFSAEGAYFAVSLRAGRRKDAALEAQVAHACRTIREEYGLLPVFVPMQPREDAPVLRRVFEASGSAGILLDTVNAAELSYLLGKYVRFTLGMRLHALIFSVAAGVPAIGIAVDGKVAAFLEEVDQPCLDAHTVTAEAIVHCAGALLEKHRTLSDTLTVAARTLRERAAEQAHRAAALFRTAEG